MRQSTVLSPHRGGGIGLEAVEQARRKGVMERFVTRWRNAGLSHTLNAWVEFVYETQRSRAPRKSRPH